MVTQDSAVALAYLWCIWKIIQLEDKIIIYIILG